MAWVVRCCGMGFFGGYFLSSDERLFLRVVHYVTLLVHIARSA